MTSLLTLTYSSPTKTLAKGDVLVTQGERGGDLYVLETGRLVVERDGVAIATIEEPNSVIGEISVLLGSPNTATVRADRGSKVRYIRDAMRLLERQPLLTLSLAQLVCRKLDTTSALVVDLRKDTSGKEESLLSRIFHALSSAPPQRGGTPPGHE